MRCDIKFSEIGGKASCERFTGVLGWDDRRIQRTAPRRGAERDRTVDLRLAKPALSQLSYSPVMGNARRVGQGRLELPTSRLSGVRSNHLSYWPSDATIGAICGPASTGARSLKTGLYATS